ncbi:MAG: UDP-N-acetylglucosamine 1-carboxyvinyltransferase [Desulfotalea sp.]
MEKLFIEGGNPLHGDIKISGAKNAALPLMAAALLAPGKHTLRNVPNLRDTKTLLQVMGELGVESSRDGDVLTIDSTNLRDCEASYDLVRTMRASVLVLGPLVARLGRARVSRPGGCAIGDRPIDLHLMGLERLGADCLLDGGYVEVTIDGKLQGNTIYFDTPSVTGTENLLMAATLAEGTTILKNAAREPEIGNLVDMLVGMGAKIEGKDSDELTIHGVEQLGVADCTIIPDRIEAGTYLIAIAASGGSGRVVNCYPNHLPALLNKLRAVGFIIDEGIDSVGISLPDGLKLKDLQAVDIKTMPYPGYATDLQAQFMALMCLVSGTSVVNETIFENRFMHVAELERMNAKIKIEGSTSMVTGCGEDGLVGAPVMATDLRASSSLVIAGLAAKGVTEVRRIYHLERGYENLVEKLTAVGAKVWKESY